MKVTIIMMMTIIIVVSTDFAIFLERTREGHRQSDEHWYSFKGNVGEPSERRGGAHMGFSERIDTLLN